MAKTGLSELEPLSPRSPYEWQVRWTLLAAALAADRPEIAAAHGAAMLDPSQQKLPGQVEPLLARTVAEAREGRLQKETESALLAAARGEGYL